jgi:hypothetical protein
VDVDGFSAARSHGTTAQRPAMGFGDDGYEYFDATISKSIYAKISRDAVISETVAQGSQSTATVKVISNTLTEGVKYWAGYSIKQSWGGSIRFRKTQDSGAGQITLVSSFNSDDKGVYFVAPSPTDFPYIYLSNNYGNAETITFELPATSWVEEDGATAGVLRSGATADRPASTDIYTGFQYFDTDDGKVIVWNGTAWVNLDGTALS